MTKLFEIIDSEKKSAKKNMEMDEKLLENLSNFKKPILHFYRWEDFSATNGYFIDSKMLKKIINLENARNKNICFARRPTGGGIIFHIWDLAFSFLLPSDHKNFYHTDTLKNYAFVNNFVKDAIKDFLKISKLELISANKAKKIDEKSNIKNFCMAKPTVYDVVIGDKKVAGAAQRRKKQGYLHQGSISIALPKEEVLKDLFIDENVFLEMKKTSFSFLDERATTLQINEIRRNLEKHLIKSLEKNLLS